MWDLETIKNIKMLVLDVDGVMTDGGLYYDEDGRVFRRFDVQDGAGIKLAQQAGIKVAVISGLKSKSTEKRIKDLGIEDYILGCKNKVDAVKKLCKKYNLTLKEVAFMGDDWVDAYVMKIVGFPMAVKNAQPEIKKIALWTSTCFGGHGAVREAIMFLLKIQGKYDKMWDKWYNFEEVI